MSARLIDFSVGTTFLFLFYSCITEKPANINAFMAELILSGLPVLRN